MIVLEDRLEFKKYASLVLLYRKLYDEWTLLGCSLDGTKNTHVLVKQVFDMTV